MAGIYWNDREKKVLKEMAESGRNAKDIAKILKSRTTNAIHIKANTMGLSLAGEKPEIDFEAFKKMMQAERSTKCL